MLLDITSESNKFPRKLLKHGKSHVIWSHVIQKKLTTPGSREESEHYIFSQITPIPTTDQYRDWFRDGPEMGQSESVK